jgi:hypothetical protein
MAYTLALEAGASLLEIWNRQWVCVLVRIQLLIQIQKFQRLYVHITLDVNLVKKAQI